METKRELIEHQDRVQKLFRREQEGMDEQQKLTGQKQALATECSKSFACLVRPRSFVLLKGSKDLADKLLPKNEGLSKPKKKGESAVEHYVHKFKHGEPLSTTGKPPVSREQAIAIGLSEEKRG